MYDPASGFIVYDNAYWWGDEWNAKSYGRDMDFDQAFFPQFLQLVKSRYIDFFRNGKVKKKVLVNRTKSDGINFNFMKTSVYL